MGIINLTPDSFYDGNKFNNEKKVNDNEREEKFPGTCFLNNDIITFLLI